MSESEENFEEDTIMARTVRGKQKCIEIWSSTNAPYYGDFVDIAKHVCNLFYETNCLNDYGRFKTSKKCKTVNSNIYSLLRHEV